MENLVEQCHQVHDTFREHMLCKDFETASAFLESLCNKDINLKKTGLIVSRSLKAHPKFKDSRQKLYDAYADDCKSRGIPVF